MSLRRVVRFAVLGLAGLVVLVVVAALVITSTGPGHRFLERRIMAVLARTIDGEVRINSIGGALWRSVQVNGLEMKTADGKLAIRAEQVAVTFRLPDLLRGRFIFRSVRLVRPVIELDEWPDGRWNIEHLFRLTGRRDSTRHAPRPLVLLQNVSITDGTLIIRARGARDTIITRVIDGLNTDLSRLRVSHPDSTALEADVRHLAARLDNPRLNLHEADGMLSLDGDSLRFEVDHVTLPGTRATLKGLMRWGGPRFALNAAINADPVAFADVRGIIPMLPAEGGGTVAVLLRLEGDGTIQADVREADVHSGRSTITGRGNFTIRPGGADVARHVDLTLQPLDFALLKPYVDSLPVRGLVRGRVQGDGALRDLVFDADVDWTDEGTAGTPLNTVDARGRLVIGARQGVEFRAVTLRRADIDMGSIRNFAPSVKLAGRLRARGTLDGPWRAAQFAGILDHYADSGQATTVHGALKLGIGGTTRVDADVVVDSLSLDLLRRTYPQIPLTGSLQGRMVMHGPLDSLNVDVALAGTPGRFTALGVIGVRDSAVTIALGGTFDSLDLRGIRAANPPSQLVGSWRADLVVPTDSLRVATGTATFDLQGVTVGGLAIGPGVMQLSLEPEQIRVVRLTLAFTGGGLEASGAIGRGATAGMLSFAAHADTIGYLEPLVRFFATTPGDSGVVKLDGRGTINGTLEGTTSAFALTADLAVDAVNVVGNHARAVRIHGRLALGPDGTTIAGKGTADSVSAGRLGYHNVSVEVAGRFDSLSVTANVGFLKSSALRGHFVTWADSAHRMLHVDSLELALPVHTWRLAAPVTVRLGGGAMTMDTVNFRVDPGTAFVLAAGTFSRGGGSTEFFLDADSIPLEDIYAMAQLDTTGVKGAFSADAKISGPAQAPVMELSAELAEGRMADYTLPLIRVQGAYQDRRLTITGGLFRDSVRIVTITGALPMDLSLQSVAQRELDGPIDITAQSDTLDMRVFNAITAAITGVAGTMALNARAGGTWDRPVFSGFVDITGGTVQVPSIGASYSGINLRLEGPGDNTFNVVRGQLHSGGTLAIAGAISFKDLAHPELRMTLDATEFAAFNIRGFGALTATGQVALTGPLIGATLTGHVVADQGALQFSNLVEKRIVSLDDPEFRAMVDSNLAGADLAPAGHQIFFDSLRIDNLSLEMGPDVWLRSSEANIQLAGAIQVQRRFDNNLARYRIDGTLRAVRGNYKLAIGLENSLLAVTRDFKVTRGTIRFFGTPDLNPEISVVAEYVTRTVQREPLTVRAIIEGTLLYPRLRLETDSPLPLTETEIASYLMFGRPSPDLGGSGLTSQVAVVAGGALGGVGQALINELGLPLNYLTITPGAGTPTSATGIASSRIEAGVQWGERTFITLTAGLCEVRAGKGVGASLEHRLSDIWSVNLAFEPVVSECGVSAGLQQLKYQFGVDLFWQSGIH